MLCPDPHNILRTLLVAFLRILGPKYEVTVDQNLGNPAISIIAC